MVTIKLEGNITFTGFSCVGNTKNLCQHCKLRFSCLTNKETIVIPASTVKTNKLKDLASLAKYMFGNKFTYEIGNRYDNNDMGEELVMKVKNKLE